MSPWNFHGGVHCLHVIQKISGRFAIAEGEATMQTFDSRLLIFWWECEVVPYCRSFLTFWHWPICTTVSAQDAWSIILFLNIWISHCISLLYLYMPNIKVLELRLSYYSIKHRYCTLRTGMLEISEQFFKRCTRLLRCTMLADHHEKMVSKFSHLCENTVHSRYGFSHFFAKTSKQPCPTGLAPRRDSEQVRFRAKFSYPLKREPREPRSACCKVWRQCFEDKFSWWASKFFANVRCV